MLNFAESLRKFVEMTHENIFSGCPGGDPGTVKTSPATWLI